MLPEFSNLIECKKCRNIFWLHKAKEIGEYSWGDDSNILWRNADNAEFLSIQKYFKALNINAAENSNEEKYIRIRIWWGYNDRIRKGERMFKFVNDEKKWKVNIDQLLKLLDSKNVYDRITIAEIHRNLGEFEKCLEIINSIADPELEWIKMSFNKECRKRNTAVFLLNEDELN